MTTTERGREGLKIAFDVDDTLLVPSVASGFGRDTPNYPVIEVYRWFQSQGHYMIIWSGSGVDWAKTWAEKFGLTADDFPMKGAYPVDIAFDDCDVKLGSVNVRVKRHNNSISRKEWNETKQPPSPSSV
jgi:hydroxymethylpyrimidine pyrophosphatase-like HAD family hydrolase